MNTKTKIGLLDWSILISIILLLFIVYIPSSIWIEEKRDRNESRFRMKAIANAAEFYKELKGTYTTDGKEMFMLVEAAIDSLYADSLFIGEQQINTKLSDKEWNIFIDNGDEFENYLYDQIMDIPFQEYVLGECIESFVDDFLQDKEW